MSSPLSADQVAALNAAGRQFDVDPALLAAVYGKESSFGTTVADPFRSFGLIAGVGEYNGYGYTATTDSFGDAAKTAAAFIKYERQQYDSAHQRGQSFLQFYDAVYAPPASNPNSLQNLLQIYKDQGGDPAGEAHYAGAPSFVGVINSGFGDPANNPLNGIIKSATGGKVDPAAAAKNLGASARAPWNDLLTTFTIGAVFLALIAGGFAIMASSSPAVTNAAKAAVLA